MRKEFLVERQGRTFCLYAAEITRPPTTTPPPTVAERLEDLIRAIVSEEVGDRIEQLESSIDGMSVYQSEQDRRIEKRSREINELRNRIDYL